MPQDARPYYGFFKKYDAPYAPFRPILRTNMTPAARLSNSTAILFMKNIKV